MRGESEDQRGLEKLSIKDLRKLYRENHKRCMEIETAVKKKDLHAQKLTLGIYFKKITLIASDAVQLIDRRSWIVVRYLNDVVLDAEVDSFSTSINEYVPGPDTWERHFVRIGEES